MKSGTGSHELTRLATAYFTSIAFGLTFLIASAAGVDGGTALLRAVTAGAIALVLGYSSEKLDFSASYFNPDESEPVFVLSVGLGL